MRFVYDIDFVTKMSRQENRRNEHKNNAEILYGK